MTRGPVDTARLIWQARIDASRLHRLAVDAARYAARAHELLEQADARVYRCPGCGEWRYMSETRGTRRPGSSRQCRACGASGLRSVVREAS